MNRYCKLEGNILYPSKDEHNRSMLTWGPFYYHSKEMAKEKIDKVLNWIVDWVNEKDKTLNIQPENLIRCSGNTMIVFKIKAWKDDEHLEECDGIITVEDIFFEDEEK